MPTIESVGYAEREKLIGALSWEYGTINTGLDLRQAIMYSTHLRPLGIAIHAEMPDVAMHLVFKTNPDRYELARRDRAFITGSIKSNVLRAEGKRIETTVSEYFAEIRKTQDGYLMVTLRTTLPVGDVKSITEKLRQPYVPMESNRYEKVFDFRSPSPRRISAA